MHKSSHQFAFIALFLWLLGNCIGLHGHFCFDGQEPPVSVHMHVDGHSPHDHHPGEEHLDADVELLQLVIAKVGKIDVGAILLAVLSLLPIFRTRHSPATRYLFFPPASPPHTRPLLRAPPLAA